jgi:hypothetical protein
VGVVVGDAVGLVVGDVVGLVVGDVVGLVVSDCVWQCFVFLVQMQINVRLCLCVHTAQGRRKRQGLVIGHPPNATCRMKLEFKGGAGAPFCKHGQAQPSEPAPPAPPMQTELKKLEIGTWNLHCSFSSVKVM